MHNKTKFSYIFKICIMIYVSLIAVYRWIEVIYLSRSSFISNQFILSTVLISLVYIWAREIHDKKIINEINVKLAMSNEKLRTANINTIASLISSVEAKDPFTFGHSERVTNYSLIIAKRMNLEEGQLGILRNAGLLHDIGKIKIPDLILHKIEELTSDDWNTIKKHPEAAIDILGPLDFLENEKQLILCHHEHYDGSGYPQGLKAEYIPEGARILALADAYDAMKSKRPYREKSLGDSQILEEIEKYSGTQFDPGIVKIFVELIKNGLIHPAVFPKV